MCWILTHTKVGRTTVLLLTSNLISPSFSSSYTFLKRAVNICCYHIPFSLFQLTSTCFYSSHATESPVGICQCPPSLVLAHQSLLVMLMLSGIFCLLSLWAHPPLKYFSKVTPFSYSSSHALLDHIITSSFVLVILKYISLLLQIQSSSVSVYT